MTTRFGFGTQQAYRTAPLIDRRTQRTPLSACINTSGGMEVRAPTPGLGAAWHASSKGVQKNAVRNYVAEMANNLRDYKYPSFGKLGTVSKKEYWGSETEIASFPSFASRMNRPGPVYSYRRPYTIDNRLYYFSYYFCVLSLDRRLRHTNYNNRTPLVLSLDMKATFQMHKAVLHRVLRNA